MEFTVGGQLAVRITAADVGKRVSVRRSTGEKDPGQRFTDTVGVLTSWDEGVLLITRRSGEVVRIAESDLVAGKVAPAAAGRGARRGTPAASAEELTRVAARAWPAVEIEPLTAEAPEGWLLRAATGSGEGRRSPGFTRRANSALALGDPGLPLDAALRRVVAWYAERGLPPYVQVGAESAETRELTEALERRGWRREVSAHVLVGALAPLADRAGRRRDRARVRLSRDVDDAWTARYGRSGGSAPEVRAVLRGGPSVWFATCPAPGEDLDTADASRPPAAIGRLVVDGRWAGFTAVEVAPELRRQGLASAVMGALAGQALEEGASAAYLQVETGNAAALALHAGLGFTVHHTYDHWRAPEEDRS